MMQAERVQERWFRHLPAHVGHTQALDLSIKAIVAACAHARGAPKLTSSDCYQALALALTAVQAGIEASHGKPNDDLLASTALLAPFDGALRKNGIPTRLHIEGQAAILSTRPSTYPVTQLARDIIAFHAYESAIIACVHGIDSPFDGVPPAYFASNRVGYNDGDRGQLNAIGIELFIRIPRLVRLFRLLRGQETPQDSVVQDATELLDSLRQLQDAPAEKRLLRNVELLRVDSFTPELCGRRGAFSATCTDIETLAHYWTARLILLKLEACLHEVCLLRLGLKLPFALQRRINEMSDLVDKILSCTDLAGKLPLRRQNQLLALAMSVVWDAAEFVRPDCSRDRSGLCDVELSELLQHRFSTALAAKPAFSAHDIQQAADIFVGKEPSGRYADLYRG